MTRECLRVRSELRAEILAHAERASPDECCGLLLGKDADVTLVVPVANVSPQPQAAFALAPAALLAAERRARELGLEVVGCYHSHPRGEARPSARDVEGASRAWSYVIAGGVCAGPLELRSYRLREDRAVFEEESIA